MIGGNITLTIKRKTGKYTKNSIGERVPEVVDYISLFGFLDLTSGDTRTTTYDTRIQESNYVFICDYVELPLVDNRKIKTSELTATCNGEDYEITFIDNPMNLNKHYEIFLKFVGEKQ